jgi:hypothetical protein
MSAEVPGAMARGRIEGGGVILAVHTRVIISDAGLDHAVILGKNQFLCPIGPIPCLIFSSDGRKVSIM